MENAAYDPSGSPPPPSYELSQTEFDQKTRQVVEESAREPPEPRVDEDGFEVWDDAVFEAALAGVASLSVGPGASTESAPSGSRPLPSRPPEKARAAPEQSSPNPRHYDHVRQPSGSGSSSAGPSTSQTRPLNVSKKTRTGKERPSWFEEAGLGTTTSDSQPTQSHADAPSQPGAQPRGARPAPRRLAVTNNTGDVPAPEVERGGTPPPEFTAVGPPLDGPPYETLVMSYHGPELDPDESMAAPPPAFDALPDTSYASQPPPEAPPQLPDHARPPPAHAQSLPPNVPSSDHPPATRPHVDHAQTMPPAAAPRAPPSPMVVPLKAYEPQSKFSGAPRVVFDPRTAYGKPLPTVPQDEEPRLPAFDASAFYNHAVAAHFSPNLPARMRQPVQTDRSSIYSQDSSCAPTSIPARGSYGGYGGPPAQAPTVVASPRPSYAYGQATFPATSNSSTDGGGTQHWR
ncbi:hypothetical protein C8Q77DRAFT_1153867 [Trametes polyzona]|nr:hypothetical protein C8Q77DRAFT_1153867 [Trametes polyzona]